MLNPLEMNFYGTRNDGSLAYREEISVPNKTVVDSNQQSQSCVLEPNNANNDGGKNSDGTGKWVDPDKGKKRKTDPYPSPYLRNYPCAEKSLPKSLQELFTPMKCNLCKCKMGSAITTKEHYSGKKHKLNIKKWFLIHPEYQDRAYSLHFGLQPRVMDPKKLYCKYCDVMLSSERQVETHYLGKKHQLAMKSGVPRNTYFNQMHKQWERFPQSTTDGRHGNGIGLMEKNALGKELSPVQKCFCELCMVSCPSEITFREHLTGAKHKKKLALSDEFEIPSAAKDEDVEEGAQRDAIAPGSSDLSIYRTPTGQYYCSTCNVTVNSKAQFVQHSDSKKHKNKVVLPVVQPPTKE